MLVITLAFSSCSGYDKLLKSDDINLKYEKAKDYYNKGQYAKALPLFKQLLTVYKGTPQEEDLLYYSAYSHYGQGEFLIASALFKNFYQFFPQSDRAEECHFRSAECFYLTSPKSSLDQTYSYKATEQMQLFINSRPQSEYIEEANKIIDEIRRKLEIKGLANADLYYKTRRYKAAATTYENFLISFPDAPTAEHVRFMIIKSYDELADRSIVCKQEERYDKVISAFEDFEARYPESRQLKDAARLHTSAQIDKKIAAEGCSEQERLKIINRADLALRNKRFEIAVKNYRQYVADYPQREDIDHALFQLIDAKRGVAQEEKNACLQVEEFDEALKSYYDFIEKYPSSTYLREAEKIYDQILKAQDKSKKDCHNTDQNT